MILLTSCRQVPYLEFWANANVYQSYRYCMNSWSQYSFCDFHDVIYECLMGNRNLSHLLLRFFTKMDEQSKLFFTHFHGLLSNLYITCGSRRKEYEYLDWRYLWYYLFGREDLDHIESYEAEWKSHEAA